MGQPVNDQSFTSWQCTADEFYFGEKKTNRQSSENLTSTWLCLIPALMTSLDCCGMLLISSAWCRMMIDSDELFCHLSSVESVWCYGLADSRLLAVFKLVHYCGIFSFHPFLYILSGFFPWLFGLKCLLWDFIPQLCFTVALVQWEVYHNENLVMTVDYTAENKIHVEVALCFVSNIFLNFISLHFISSWVSTKVPSVDLVSAF